MTHPPRYTPCSSRKNRKENGIKYCAMCDKNPVQSGRIKYCSEECSEDAMVRAGFFANAIYRRDKGVCANCGRDTKKDKAIYSNQHKDNQAWETLREELGLKKWYYGELYDIDHIIPVEDGGGSCGLENLQTLCKICHRIKTKEQARAKAIKRRERETLFDNKGALEP